MQQDQQPGGLFRPGQAPSNVQAPLVQEPAPRQPAQAGPDLTWTASEFVHHDKQAGWYAMFLLGSLAVIGLIYFITKDWFSAVVLIIFAISFMVFAARKPRVLNYALGNNGIQVGQKFFPMGMFKSFAIIEEGAIHSIVVMPLKRFMPPISIYFELSDEEKIVEFLGSRLPQETRKQDAVDRLMTKIRF